MKSDRGTERGSASLWRWLLGIVGANLFLILAGFLVPPSDEQVYSAAMQHLLRAQSGYPTTAYVWTEADLAAEARSQLTAYASERNVHLIWEGEFSALSPDFVEDTEASVRISFGRPERGIGFTRLAAGVSSDTGGRRSEIVLYHWMGICEVWQENPDHDF